MKQETDKKKKRHEKEQVEEELHEELEEEIEIKHGINQLSRYKAHRFSVL